MHNPNENVEPHDAPKDEILDPKTKALADYLIVSHNIRRFSVTDTAMQAEIRVLKAEDKTAWADISATLNDIDEQRISHCKDDIDTLLVFVRWKSSTSR